MKYPNMLYTALLFAILVVPFAISFVAPVLEPYPAVLLPSGADRIKVSEDQMHFERTAIYGRVAAHEAWIRLFPLKFLYPVPPQHFPLLAQRYFGLSSVGPVVERTKVGFIITINPRKVSEEEVKNSKQWLRARLNESGCDNNVLRITQEVVTVRRSTGKETAIRYQNDKVFDLR
jgi:hypothetical protein